ncbi:hypothetical protein AB0F17_61855 [Nonomuraea sp. NPDC026600]|uniref:hypothetical protein n=1 Tax=Nonomuraea sp. NPDC026600 TaxID=3155363 RepID=UPI0033F4BAFD
MSLPKDHELLHAAGAIAAALGIPQNQPADLAAKLEQEGRSDWSASDLLLAALAQLAEQRQAEHRWSTELRQADKAIAESTGTTFAYALSHVSGRVRDAAASGKPWLLHVRGPNGAGATFRTLDGVEVATIAKTWQGVLDAQWAEWRMELE